MTFTLRDAALQDTEILQKIVQTAFAEYDGRLDPPSSVHTETLEQIQEKLSKGGAVLALAGKTYAGCVLYYPQEDYLYLGRLSVLPDFRRQGVAQALVKYVECKAAQMGIRKVQLSVRITLVNNRAFFEKLGYRVISRHSHRGYTEPTFVTLEK